MTASINRPGRIVGYVVAATDGHLGKVDGSSEATGRQYLVVDTGCWLSGRKRLIPVGVITSIDHPNEAVHLSLTTDQVGKAPDYDGTTSEADAGYFDRHASYYEPYRSQQPRP